MTALRPEVYGVEGDLPSYLHRVDEALVFDQAAILEGSPGPYDMVTDYGGSLRSLQEPTGIGEWPQGIEVHARTNDVARAVDNLTELANLKGIDINHPAAGVLYSANFVGAFVPALDAALAGISGDWTLLTFLRGGKIVQDIVHARGYRPTNVPQIRASRVVTKDMNYHIGLRSLSPSIEIAKKVVGGDDCMAAAGTLDTGLRWATALNPEVDSVRIAVGVAVARSADAIHRTWGNNGYDYKAHAGGLARGMNEHYYLAVTDEEQAAGVFPRGYRYRVGDMGGFMNLENSERAAWISPVVYAVATEKVSFDNVFEATSRALREPEEQLEKQALWLLEAARRRL